MVFDGTRTRLVEKEERDCRFNRCGKFVNREGREEQFMAGRELLYKAMNYAMSLEIEGNQCSIS
jgi:hypothetical protein